MSLPQTLTATTLTLLLATLFSSPSCTTPPCDATTDSCPCTRPEDCHPHPPCTAISCDGTCHVFPMAAGVGCLIEPCTDPDVCHGVCDGLGTCIGCLQNTDCAPGHTCEPGNVCSRCDDGIQNGDETAIDCGGSCPLCPGTCNVDADCPGGYCWEGLCVRCDDVIQNGDEQGVDCGTISGHCPAGLGSTALGRLRYGSSLRSGWRFRLCEADGESASVASCSGPLAGRGLPFVMRACRLEPPRQPEHHASPFVPQNGA